MRRTLLIFVDGLGIGARGAYNPLVIVGGAGSGKTHLAHAIGNGLANRDAAQWSVACVAGQAFVDELGDALDQERVEQWRARYRAVDALGHSVIARPTTD